MKASFILYTHEIRTYSYVLIDRIVGYAMCPGFRVLVKGRSSLLYSAASSGIGGFSSPTEESRVGADEIDWASDSRKRRVHSISSSR